MLDKTQEQLLVLLEEIDNICRENNITYFLDGGTVIGAVRHEGFIPWDNDADIAMTEENYNRFVEIVNRDTEKTHRTVQDMTINSEHPLEIGKYINLDMTKITTTGAFWDENDANAGMVVDIFKLIPLPKDEEEKEKRCQLINLYSEYCNETLGRSEKRTDYFDREYKKLIKEGEKYGRAHVKERLEKELFNQHYDDFDEYLYCTGSRRHPRVFPRETYDREPIRVKFENLELPIMQNYHEFLRLFYGDDYWKIPTVEAERRVHTSLYSDDIPYKYYVRDYMRMLDRDTVRGRRVEAKNSFVELAEKRKHAVETVSAIDIERVKLSLNKRIAADSLNLKKEFEDKNYELLEDIFYEYYNLQFINYCKRYPIVVDLPEEQLYYAILNLIYSRDDIAKAAWIIKSYKSEVSRNLPASIEKIEKLLDCIFIARSALDYGDYDRGWNAINEGLEMHPDNWDLRMWKLSYEANLLPLDELDGMEGQIDAFDIEFPGRIETAKARGDLAWRRGSRDEAMNIYDSIFDKTHDGLLRLDITRKRKEC